MRAENVRGACRVCPLPVPYVLYPQRVFSVVEWIKLVTVETLKSDILAGMTVCGDVLEENTLVPTHRHPSRSPPRPLRLLRRCRGRVYACVRACVRPYAHLHVVWTFGFGVGLVVNHGHDV